MSAQSLHMRAMAGVDPLRVPLPIGTEVVTRVDRVDNGRTIRAGALGRVKHLDADRVSVQVVGVGQVWYSRSEVAPCRAGQARYAARRDANWTALRPCVVVESVVGSRAWGLAHEGSDTDRRGIFVPPFTWTTGLVPPPEDIVSLDATCTYWSAYKLVRQALRADPNTLETLFVEGASAMDPMGQWILDARRAFVSANIYGSFGRYALSQLKKMQKAIALIDRRQVVLGWLRAEPTLTMEDVAQRIANMYSEDHPSGPPGEYVQAKHYVKDLYRSLYDQGIVEENSFKGLVRFAEQATEAELDLPREMRPKNAYNLLRLIGTATQWLRTGEVDFRVSGPLRDRLLAIKRGEVPLADVVRDAEEMAPELEAARRTTRLPEHPDLRAANDLVRRLGEEAARRWASGAPTVFGQLAPPPPQLEWDDAPEEPTGNEPT